MLVLILSCFVSCESGVVLGIPRKEVLENLKNQSIDFILNADLGKMAEIKKLHPSAPFYVGLLVKAAGDTVRAALLFEEALKSSSEQIRLASAVQLLPFMTQKDRDSSLLNRIERRGNAKDVKNDSAIQTLRNAALYGLHRYREMQNPLHNETFSSWNQGFSLLAALKTNEVLEENQKQEFRDYFLKGMMSEAQIWVFRELQEFAPLWTSSAEINAIEGRIAVSKSDFNEGIARFKTVLEENQGLFFVYIDLLHDLGRAFQFTKYQQEGIELFSEWEMWLRTGTEIGPSILTIDIPENHYRLLYFIGRIEQQRQNHIASIASFAEALKLTSDKNQQDACIWYILNAVLLENPAEIQSFLLEYSSQWNDDAYFSDIMDRRSFGRLW